MKISEIKENMRVRVNNNLSRTESKWTFGGSDDMPNMKGKTYMVEHVGSTNRGVRIRNGSNTWIFCPEDLSLPKETKPIPPVMFDPDDICI